MKTDGTRSLLDGLEEEGPVPSCAHQWEEAHQWRYEWRSPDGPGYSRVDERVARCRRCGEVRPWNAADEAAFEARLRAAKRMDAHDYIDGLRKRRRRRRRRRRFGSKWSAGGSACAP